MKKELITGILFLFSINLFSQNNEVLFQFRQKKGESSLHVSTIEEEAYLNGRLNNRTQIVNRTATTVLDQDENGNALLSTHYMTTENYLMSSSGRHLNWGEEDFVTVTRTKNGMLLNPDNPYLPTVQNVPSFPDYAVSPGDTWTSEGKEIHDCRELFAMDYAIELPFTAQYKYAGDEVINGITMNVVEVYYEFAQKISRATRATGTYAGASGYAQQKIYWDCLKGEIDHYTESFMIKMFDVSGVSYIFKSKAHGEVLEYKSVNDSATVEKLQESVAQMELDNVNIAQGEKGLTISLENIQFEPDSNILLQSEKIKLQKIGQLIKDYSNDLIITGHCAARGSVSARQKLSEQRAESVAAYLVQIGIRDKLHIFTQGKGSEQPVASNETEEGRSKNRRVEIILAD